MAPAGRGGMINIHLSPKRRLCGRFIGFIMYIPQLLVLGMARQNDEFKERLGRVPLDKVEILVALQNIF